MREQDFKILLVDDDPNILRLLDKTLKPEGYLIFKAGSGAEAFENLKEHDIDLVLLDIQLPDIQGMEILRSIKSQDKEIEVVIITGYPAINLAVEAIRLGAYDFLTKPIDTMELVKIAVAKALERRQIIRENRALRESLEKEYHFSNMVGRSKGMQDIFKLVRRLSQSESTVLIQGETGTGKELIAKSIHFNSPRKTGRFIPVDCGAIPDNLMESELFGHLRGAFTGAMRERKGLFREADGGTLLLDEIGELSMPLQVKLLRVLQEREIRQVGGEKAEPVDVRIISATNRDVEEAVKRGEFREDLFYRLNVINIKIPPLRERPEDIPLLIQYFLAKQSEKLGKKLSIEPGALKKLANYYWPGNVRQLEHCLEQMAVLSTQDVLTINDMPDSIMPQEQTDLKKVSGSNGSLKEYETMAIKNAMTICDGDIDKAAKILGIAKSSLYRKLKEHGVNKKQFIKKENS